MTNMNNISVNLMKSDIKSLEYDQIQKVINEIDEPSYRARQIFEWLHKNGVSSFDEMTNVSKLCRNKLSEKFYISKCNVKKKFVSKIDGTVKYVFELNDGELIESAIMRYKYGNSICVSTQVGCKMGCSFCASTIAGFVRDLTAGEIESEINCAMTDLNEKISNVVLMGIGEGLDNYNNVLAFMKNVNSNMGLNISMRNITISSCGIVPNIYALMYENLQITLAISLHAPNDYIRSKIMPVNKKWGIDELIKACRDYTKKTNRRITFEYTLIDGVNDSEECAYQLSKLLKNMMCNVNLIRLNQVKERELKKSNEKTVNKFKEILQGNSISVTIRRTLGADIDASCGQLRRNEME